MSRKRKPRATTLENRLSDVSMTLAGINGGTGGSYLSSYNTWGFSNNYSLITLNRIILTYMYTGNGIFQTAIQLPVQDAIGKGIEIESGELDNSDIDNVLDFWEENRIWNTILNYMTWVRLFGGGALLINTNQDPAKPFSFKKLDKTPLEFYDLDRWQLDTNIAIFDDWDSYLSSVSDGTGLIHLYGQPIHESRFLRGQGKRAPHYVRRQLRGWGMSEGERMIRDLNLYLKTQDSTFELIDEAKVDIYKINGLANKLLTTGGTSAITQRIQSANEIKNYVNALVLDANEDYEQKNMVFSGISEIMNQNRMGVAAALRMPMTKLFGISASGFNTGESDLENYNMMVESEVRAQIRSTVRTLLKIVMGHLFGYIPKFTFKFPPLREQTAEVEQNVKTQEANRLFAIYDRGLMDSQETMESLRKAGVVQIETKTEQGLNPNPEPPEPSSQTGAGISTATPAIRTERTKANSRKNADFKEEEHPRDESGKFGKGGGSKKKKDLIEKAVSKNPKLKRWGIDFDSVDDNGNYIIYHGTNQKGYEKILSEGLKAPESPKFFTTTTDKDVAKEFAKGYSGDKIVKFAVPVEDITGVLWKGHETSVYQEEGETDTQHALKTGLLDKKYIVDEKQNPLTYSGHKLQGRTKYQGFEISIEQKKGSTRKGVDADGAPWKTKFKYPYGYILGTIGVYKDHVDCYIGDNPDSEEAYIIHQNVPETGKYDEDKIMLGFNSRAEAKKAYEGHYNKPGFFGDMKVIPMDKLEKLLEKRKGKKL